MRAVALTALALVAAVFVSPPADSFMLALTNCRTFEQFQSLLKSPVRNKTLIAERFIRDWFKGKFITGTRRRYLTATDQQETAEESDYIRRSVTDASLLFAVLLLGHEDSPTARQMLSELLKGDCFPLFRCGSILRSPRHTSLGIDAVMAQFYATAAIAAGVYPARNPRFAQQMVEWAFRNPEEIADSKCWDCLADAAHRCNLLPKILPQALKDPPKYKELIYSAASIRPVWRHISLALVMRFLKHSEISTSVKVKVATAMLTCGSKPHAQLAIKWLVDMESSIDSFTLSNSLCYQTGIIPPHTAANLIRLTRHSVGKRIAAKLAASFCRYYCHLLHPKSNPTLEPVPAFFHSLTAYNLHLVVMGLTGQPNPLPRLPRSLPQHIRDSFLSIVANLCRTDPDLQKAFQRLKQLCNSPHLQQQMKK